MIARRIFTVALAAAALGAAGFTVSEGQSRDGQNRRVRVHNQTGAVLQTLQAADVRTGTFGSDLLGGTPVAAGSSVPVTIDTFGASNLPMPSISLAVAACSSSVAAARRSSGASTVLAGETLGGA